MGDNVSKLVGKQKRGEIISEDYLGIGVHLKNYSLLRSEARCEIQAAASRGRWERRSIFRTRG